MNRFLLQVLIGLATFVLGVAAVSLVFIPRFTPKTHVQHSIPVAVSTPPSTALSPSDTHAASPIRLIDFSNFTHPRTAGLRTPGGRRTFELKGGRFEETKSEVGMHMGDIIYGDVTGDGEEEAMVSLGVETGGSAIPNCVYIYTIVQKKPALLWAFETGDRADGGLRRVYAEGGGLVVELYGKGTHPGGELYGSEDTPACCAKSVTRTRYRWDGRRFVQQGESEVFANPANNSGYVGG